MSDAITITLDVQNIEVVQKILDDKDAEIARLRERVRCHAINVEPDRDWVGCGECSSAWPWGEPEAHASDCIAAPTKKKETTNG